MVGFSNYEEYYQLFKKGNQEEQQRVSLLWLLRSWQINRIEQGASMQGYTSVDELTSHIEPGVKDGLSKIIDNIQEAFIHISQELHQKIIRENMLLPIHKVREINSYGINWLSKRNGRTLREKLSGSKTMMAVQRRSSADTGENRLFLAFIKRLIELIDVKFSCMPKSMTRKQERDFQQRLLKLIRSEDVAEIKRWENLPPNNTLLSDRYYSKIWRGWNDLQALDKMVVDDAENISKLLKVYFAWSILEKARQDFHLVQLPVICDYTDFKMDTLKEGIYGISNNGNVISLNWNESNIIRIKYANNEYSLIFKNNESELRSNQILWHEYITTENISDAVDKVCAKLWKYSKKKEKKYNNKYEAVHGNQVIIDIFAIRPQFLLDGANFQMPFRMLREEFIERDLSGGKKRIYDISLDSTQSVLVSDEDQTLKTYSLNAIIQHSNDGKMSRLLHQAREYIKAGRLSFLCPDVYNDFQLGTLRRGLRLYYPNVDSVPRSISTVFYLSKFGVNNIIPNKFSEQDCIIVIDLIDNQFTFSLLEAVYKQELEAEQPATNGVQWIRHPTDAVSAEIYDNCGVTLAEELSQKLLENGCDQHEEFLRNYAIEGIACEKDRLVITSAENQNFVINEHITILANNIKGAITGKLQQFIKSRENYIQNKNIYVVSLSSKIGYNGDLPFAYLNVEQMLEGAHHYSIIAEGSTVPLWQDHLPDLAIKLFYGTFDLVKDQQIEPKKNNVKEIIINNYFTLTKGLKAYHFQLLQNDGNSTMQYEAVVKHNTFPLAEDTNCRLHMTYNYGEDDPYNLVFEPVNSEKAGFREAKVTWHPIDRYETDNFQYPEYPSIPTWNELREMPNKDNTEKRDLLDWITNHLGKIIVSKPIIDFSRFRCELIHGMNNYHYMTAVGQYEGKHCIIKINKKDLADNISFTPYGLGILECNLQCTDKWRKRISTNELQMYTIRGTGEYAASASMNLEGENHTLKFYRSNFIFPNEYRFDCNLTFSYIINKGNRKCFINDILTDQYDGYSVYHAKNVRQHTGKVTYDINQLDKTSIMYPMHVVFNNGRSIYDDACPQEFKDYIQKVVPKLVDLYKSEEIQLGKKNKQINLLRLLFLLASDCEDEVYPVIFDAMECYKNNINMINDEIGCALGACTTSKQAELLNRIISINNNKKIIGILSKAVWKNEEFVMNAPPDILLRYFDIAIDNLVNDKINKNVGKLKTLEYIIAIFRLRSFNNSAINERLSLNNHRMRLLYKHVEKLISEKNGWLERSRLNFEITQPDEWKSKNIPDMLYALLVYITGESGVGEIKITKITDNEDEIL